MSVRRYHRHLLVLPCCIVAALVPAFAQRTQWEASVVPTEEVQYIWVGGEADQPVALADATSLAFLTPGTRLELRDETYAMQSGSMTFRTRAPLRVQAGEWTLLAWHGAGQITVGTKITVAALDAPLLLQKNGRRFVVPPGMSLSLSLSAELPGPEEGWCPWVTSLAADPLPDVFILEQAELLRALPAAQTPRTPEEVAWLADAGHDDVDLWMLLSLHPDAAGMTWLHAAPASATVDDLLQRMAVLPFVDRAKTPISPLVLSRLVATLDESVVEYGEGERLAFIIERLQVGADELRTLGFPERAERYADAAMALHAEAERFQSLPEVACRNALPSEPADDRAPAVQASLLVAASRGDLAPLDPEAVRGRLSDLGGLLTRESVIRALSDGSIEVAPVLFAHGQGYRTFRLLLDGQMQTALQISEGTQTYPNAMPLPQFAAWAKGE